MISIEKTAEKILTSAIRSSASDIHIFFRREGPLIQFRIDNKLVPQETISFFEAERLIAHLKFLAAMDIGEKRRPQSGAITINLANQVVGLRLSTLPTAYLESLVIRLIPQQNILPLEQLSLFPNTVQKLIALLKHSHGMLIFTGPTGSGKTTTLYSLLHHAHEMINRNIISLEDPIENVSEKVLQVQINEKAGITYSVGLKAVLRHDPDVIMVGEVRDAETAKIAVRAALTGHLILTTMHTRDAQGAISRLLEFGVSLLEIEQSLIGVTAQRLVELSCVPCKGDCAIACQMTARNKRASVYELLYGKSMANVLRMMGDEKGKGTVSYRQLKDEIGKAVAMGYVDSLEYERLVYDEAKK
ncbi:MULTISPECIES: competence type IV pilus ATPase ComGA [Peribacillus]|uniref:competence type IV pilus ATPase ComGA n=1 Tax=Peribacillus TaxID=2675229 RepID=UPI000B64750C|nr:MULTISPECIES: competence type IV pilus ATPase ComGA [Peribacillus]MDV7765210.1 competence type IV pilus ATPase ComGA [Peribacillus sp. CSMR9]MDW7614560.1 competence type IV pilus ATPase ComGA [Peribacillus simplex]SNS57927.1 competence-related pilin export protein ComGA [Bacillus sp. OK838]